MEDFLNSIFGRRRRGDGSFPGDLPRDILDDLGPYRNQPPQGFTFWHQSPGDQEDDHSHYNGPHNWPGFGGFFSHPHDHDEDGEFFDSHPQDFFSEIDRLFEGLFQGFPDLEPHGRVPGITFPPHGTEPGTSDDQPLRDKMLKPEEPGPAVPPETAPPPMHGFRFPFGDFFGRGRQPGQGDSWNSYSRGDRDLDAELNDGKLDLDDVLKPKTPQQHSSSASVSSSTIIHGNGAAETRKTKRDSNGNEEITVTRTLGNRSHSRTYKTDSEGNQEIVEDMTNMDQDNLKDFEEKWAQATGHRQEWSGPSNRLTPPEAPKSLLDSVRDLFFPR